MQQSNQHWSLLDPEINGPRLAGLDTFFGLAVTDARKPLVKPRNDQTKQSEVPFRPFQVTGFCKGSICPCEGHARGTNNIKAAVTAAHALAASDLVNLLHGVYCN